MGVIATKDTVKRFLQPDVVYYPIQGLPDGFTFHRKMRQQVDSMMMKGYLMAWVPDKDMTIKGNYHYEMVLHLPDASKKDIDDAFKKAESKLISKFNNNL